MLEYNGGEKALLTLSGGDACGAYLAGHLASIDSAYTQNSFAPVNRQPGYVPAVLRLDGNELTITGPATSFNWNTLVYQFPRVRPPTLRSIINR